MRTEHHTLSKPYPRFKIILRRHEFVISIGNQYFRIDF